ncbi:MAG: serine/threonine-protein phosphatase [Planctomycetota bacterium]|nr:MAG: serine/threonine-protein phosphatase [Planctomycetota bacterium]REJ88576.1 MAG: serine/threonine-protein phosphatase [Planctomycetota bacterium]REK17548.1 MAG: serine/threonine-protein phosphatase [Planctomycetota bacterium]
MAGKMDCHGMTDIGRVREVNEDQFLIADLIKSMRIHETSLSHDDQTRLFGDSQGKLFVVADGVSGQSGGRQASTIAIDEVLHYVLNSMRWFFRLTEDPEDDFVDDLKAAMEHCQSRFEIEMSQTPQRYRMATTLTMGYVVWPRLYVVHAGDSRCYLFRESRLEQITNDHTMAQKYIDHGLAKPGQVEGTRWSNVLWNVLGGDSNEVRPSVYKAELRVGDTLLFCSDGLNKHVGDAEIADLLKCDASAEQLCSQLIDAANAGGGTDNITAVIALFREVEVTKEAASLEAVVEEDTLQQNADKNLEPIKQFNEASRHAATEPAAGM